MLAMGFQRLRCFSRRGLGFVGHKCEFGVFNGIDDVETAGVDSGGGGGRGVTTEDPRRYQFADKIEVGGTSSFAVLVGAERFAGWILGGASRFGGVSATIKISLRIRYCGAASFQDNHNASCKQGAVIARGWMIDGRDRRDQVEFGFVS